jgi:hypothetical protein
MSENDPVSEYYEGKRKELEAAREALREAEKDGAPADELARLRRRVEYVAYVGD